jgi:asparagine synthase (glutamine-hydrolysing)
MLDDTPETFYSDITQIPAGTAFELTLNGQFKQWQYWSVEDVPVSNVSNPAAAFAELFEDAVRLHMRSDVPVGVHLSGGLDSTSIICASARLREAAGAVGPLMAFSYGDPNFDESKYIDDTIEQTGATLVRLSTSPGRLWELLSEVLRFQDEPIHSMTPLVGYELMRVSAANGVKVILKGQGADETIAGYGSYFPNYWCGLIRQGRMVEAWHEMGRYTQAHGGSRSAEYLQNCKRTLQGWLGGSRAYREMARARRSRADVNGGWFTQELSQQRAIGDSGRARIGLNEELAYSIEHDPLPLYLRVEDRNSMAHSVEARLPFLDYRVVSFLFGLPPEWRLRGHLNKYVLREAMRSRIPESVRSRVDKMGFPVSQKSWFADALAQPVLDIMASREARERGIYNTEVIVRDIERHRKGEIDASAKIFKAAQYEVWCGL